MFYFSLVNLDSTFCLLFYSEVEFYLWSYLTSCATSRKPLILSEPLSSSFTNQMKLSGSVLLTRLMEDHHEDGETRQGYDYINHKTAYIQFIQAAFRKVHRSDSPLLLESNWLHFSFYKYVFLFIYLFRKPLRNILILSDECMMSVPKIAGEASKKTEVI